ncbi:MAG: trimethylamine methyltransferase family protein, partial [Pseudomonadota bacterium]
MATMRSIQREGRRGGRASRREARASVGAGSWPVLDRLVPAYNVLSEDRLEALHQASIKLLEEIGIDFRDDEAVAMWKEAGADVQGYRVRIPEALLMNLVAKAPSRFTVLARNPERNSDIGGNKVAFAPTYGSPFVYDMNGERR